MIIITIGFIGLYCFDIKQVFGATFFLGFFLFVAPTVVYEREMDLETVITNLAVVVGFFISAFTLTLMLTHVRILHSKLLLVNNENAKLLNGMHEGVLIRKKQRPSKPNQTASKKLMYMNRSAKKMVNDFVVVAGS